MEDQRYKGIDPLVVYIQTIDDTVYTQEEEQQLWEQMRQGCSESREKLITSQLRLVLKLAGELKQGYNVPLEDMVSVGNLALIELVDSWFDPYKGRLTTATYQYLVPRLANHRRRGVIHIPETARNSQYRSQAEQAMRVLRLASPDESEAYLDVEDTHSINPLDWAEFVVDTKEQAKAILLAVDKVADPWKGVLQAKIKGLTYKEIAEARGVSLERVRQLAIRAQFEVIFFLEGNPAFQDFFTNLPFKYQKRVF